MSEVPDTSEEFCSFRKARLSTERWIEIVFCALNDVRHATDQKKLGIASDFPSRQLGGCIFDNVHLLARNSNSSNN